MKHTASPLDEQLKSFVYDITEQIWQEKFNKSMKCFVDDALAHCLSIAVVDEDKKDELYGQLKMMSNLSRLYCWQRWKRLKHM